MDASAAAAPVVSATPDVTLRLDEAGVIRGATLSAAVPAEDLASWIGRPWFETVVDPGSEKVQRILDDARTQGVSGFRQVNQRFPSGLELPMEYTAVRLGERGLVAVGKSLRVVADLQSRLVAAQQAIERDYWRLREVETRCRLLFDHANESVLLLRANDLSILEANPSAMRALGLSPQASERARAYDLLAALDPADRAPFDGMLHRVRDQGKAPGILVRLGPDREPTVVRASLLPSQDGLSYLLQLTPAAGSASLETGRFPLDELVERSPDAFVVLDGTGCIEYANRAFLDLVQVGERASVVGERLGRWLGRPGADLAVLLASVARHGSVRLFSTSLQGELGVSTEVEIAATGETEGSARRIGAWIRDVSSRLPAPGGSERLVTALGSFSERIGRTSLPQLVKEAVRVVEQHYIQAALELTGGNRTAAAQLLGVSRQSLHAKLNRYGFEGLESSTRIE